MASGRRSVELNVEDQVLIVGGAAVEDPDAKDEAGSPLRIPFDRLGDDVRLHRDEGHRQYWLTLVGGRRVEVSAETMAAVEAALPYRATYDRDRGAPREPH